MNATSKKIRLHVAIAHAGIASRRKAEELIAAGNVKVNGKIVKEQGIMINPAKDKVIVNGENVQEVEHPLYFEMYKPRDVVSTVSDPDGKRTVIDVFRKWWLKNHPEAELPHVYPVGRLDEESEGLMLLTNDGDLAYRLTHPKFEVEKVYHVLLRGNPTNTQLNALSRGVKLKEGFSAVDRVSLVKHESGNMWISLMIHQGLHRQVRRTCAQVGLEILKLVRVQMGPLELGALLPGQVEQIKAPKV